MAAAPVRANWREFSGYRSSRHGDTIPYSAEGSSRWAGEERPEV
jgi:hypothetical protein